MSTCSEIKRLYFELRQIGGIRVDSTYKIKRSDDKGYTFLRQNPSDDSVFIKDPGDSSDFCRFTGWRIR